MVPLQEELDAAVEIESLTGRLLALSELDERAPNHPDVLLELGKCLLRLGDFAEAERALLRCRELDDDGWASLYLGNLYWQTGDLVAAEEHFLAAQSRLPEDACPVWSRADIAEARGDGETAEQLYREAVALEPQEAIAVAHLGHFLLRTDRQEAGQAYILQALELDPMCKRAWKARDEFDF